MPTKIEWTDETWNPVRGCTRVSPGCGGPGKAGGCYAEAMAARFSNPGNWGHTFAEMRNGEPHWTGRVALIEHMLDLPFKWKTPRKVFVNSTSDLHHEDLPDEAIDQVYARMALNPHLTFQILTKRSARMRRYISGDARHRIVRVILDLLVDGRIPKRLLAQADWPLRSIGDPDCPEDVELAQWPLPNVWLGVSTEDQERADERIPNLLATSAAIRFVSAEPLLGPVDFEPWLSWPSGGGELPDGTAFGCYGCEIGACRSCPKDRATYHCEEGPRDETGCPEYVHCERRTIDQVIVGGESGPKARPMHPDWARLIRDQCANAGTAFFFKQWGEWLPVYDRARDDPDWQRCDIVRRQTPKGRWLNLAGGSGFHGECVVRMDRVGKARAGHLLDGREHHEFPETSHA